MSLATISDRIDSIVSLYNYKVPFVVAEYLCMAYHQNIVFNLKINYKNLFANFIEHKDNIKYVFGKAIDGGTNKSEYTFIKLSGVEIDIPIGKDESFMEKYSNLIFGSSVNCGLEWFDEEDYPNEKIDLDKSKYIGRCKITF